MRRKLAVEVKTEVEEKIAALRSALVSEDLEKLERAISELSLSLQKIGQAMYNKENNGNPGTDEEKREDTGTVSS